MPIRRSPNSANHPRPQAGRDRPERVVAINRNSWSRSPGARTNEYLDSHIKDWIVWLTQFEPQFAIAELAVHGRPGLDEVAHMPLPFVRHAS
jgi:hypothetical protein